MFDKPVMTPDTCRLQNTSCCCHLSNAQMHLLCWQVSAQANICLFRDRKRVHRMADFRLAWDGNIITIEIMWLRFGDDFKDLWWFNASFLSFSRECNTDVLRKSSEVAVSELWISSVFLRYVSLKFLLCFRCLSYNSFIKRNKTSTIAVSDRVKSD